MIHGLCYCMFLLKAFVEFFEFLLQFFQSWRALFRSTTAEQRAEAFKNVVPKVETLERAFKECSKGKDFFGGDAIGIVDLALGSYLVWIRAVDEVSGTNLLDEEKFPGLVGWAQGRAHCCTICAARTGPQNFRGPKIVCMPTIDLQKKKHWYNNWALPPLAGPRERYVEVERALQFDRWIDRSQLQTAKNASTGPRLDGSTL
jgi:hypothetical protein